MFNLHLDMFTVGAKVESEKENLEIISVRKEEDGYYIKISKVVNEELQKLLKET